MFTIGILAPGLVLGVIAWGVVGVLRQRGREEFTLATAASFYAQVMILAGLLATLAGAAVMVKLGLSLVDPAYSFASPQSVPAGYTQPSIHDQQVQDLILAAMLIGVGLLMAFGHWLLARFARHLPGGSPAWIVRGTLVALTVLAGLTGFLSAIVAGFQVLSYFIVGAQTGMSFGDAAGGAVVFLPAWLVIMTVLLRRLHGVPAPPSRVIAAAG